MTREPVALRQRVERHVRPVGVLLRGTASPASGTTG